MALKRSLTEEEKFGLTEEEAKRAEKYLRKYKTAGAIPENESIGTYEMFMIGTSFYEIHQQFPRYSVDQIILTAALRGWTRDREKMMGSLRDRVQTKVVKSVIEQVDFLTTMLSVTNIEHLNEMRKYITDPENNPKPSIRVESIKEYKEVVDTLSKLVQGATGDRKTKASAMFETLNPKNTKSLPGKVDEEDDDIANIIAGEISE
jgi:hypothetical protein